MTCHYCGIRGHNARSCEVRARILEQIGLRLSGPRTYVRLKLWNTETARRHPLYAYWRLGDDDTNRIPGVADVRVYGRTYVIDKSDGGREVFVARPEVTDYGPDERAYIRGIFMWYGRYLRALWGQSTYWVRKPGDEPKWTSRLSIVAPGMANTWARKQKEPGWKPWRETVSGLGAYHARKRQEEEDRWKCLSSQRSSSASPSASGS